MGKMERRKRGGQKGNTNALKYGFYTRKLRRVEKTDLDKIDFLNNLHDEILMLKVMIRRVWELSSADTKDLDQCIAALDALGQGAMRQSRLMSVESQINGDDQSEANQAIAEAIRKVAEEYNSISNAGVVAEDRKRETKTLLP
jgi:hypothetical protein